MWATAHPVGCDDRPGGMEGQSVVHGAGRAVPEANHAGRMSLPEGVVLASAHVLEAALGDFAD